jgi:oligopeptide/dipeptide ABC transporter ATP-binding protein
MSASRNDTLLDVQDLKTAFFVREGVITAVDGVSFSLNRGQVLGVVGESGCGKSVTALSIMRLVSFPGRVVSGHVFYNGKDLLVLTEHQMRAVRGNQISMIFQEPMTSLNPVYTIGNQIAETIRLHQKIGTKEAYAKGVEMLRLVGIPSPESRIKEYPHQLSGGMRQRVMIAMALSCQPGLLIADEPTTALDVTIQAQILDLVGSLRERLGMAILFITHDLGVIAENADQVMVMYAGKVVETAGVESILENPLHPYTRGLIQSIPQTSRDKPGKTLLNAIPGNVPQLLRLPEGCRFHDRCGEVREGCRVDAPELVEFHKNHFVRCFSRIQG